MDDAIARWKAAGAAGDADAAATALADDVLLVSPLTDGFAFQGREEVRELLAAVFTVLTGVVYREELRDGDRVALFASATVRGVAIEESQLIRLDAEGMISEIRFSMRPLPALTAFVRALGPVIARSRGRKGTAAVLTAAGGFLDSVARSGDRVFLPMGAPERVAAERG